MRTTPSRTLPHPPPRRPARGPGALLLALLLGAAVLVVGTLAPTTVGATLTPVAGSLSGAVGAAGAADAVPAAASGEPSDPWPVTPDGTTSARAAASCWEIKQVTPSAPSGVYWLQTGQLGAPARFHCDQTTDGGGWVLVARGRQDWAETYDGNTSPSVMAASAITGPSAFGVRQLSAKVVDGLFGGRRVDTSPVRLVRSTTADGSGRQEVRMRFGDRDRWTWSFGAPHDIDAITVDGVSVPAGSTRTAGSDGLRAVRFIVGSANGWTRGFNYGSQVRGTTSSDSHLYSRASGGGYATPFTQVWVRPQITQSDLGLAPLREGEPVPAVTGVRVPSNRALPQQWGVTGLGAGGSEASSAEVQAFQQIGDTMFVGGNFTTVQRGASATGSDRIDQPYLAAFDATTGEPIRAFRPRINHQVRDLAVLPDGSLAVAGDFSTVNSAGRRGLVALDPATGTISSAPLPQVEDRRTNAPTPVVRAVDVADGMLYVGGRFTHLVSPDRTVYARNAGRIAAATGVPDRQWNPEVNGTVVDLDAGEDGARVYLAGHFTTVHGTETISGAALGTGAGAPIIPWKVVHSAPARYQQAVREVGDKVWLGGSQHNMFGYARDTLELVSSHLTYSGGDFQAMTDDGEGVVYGGCHCDGYAFSGVTQYNASTWMLRGGSWTQADKIEHVGAWDAATGAYLPQFTPELRARQTLGSWALEFGDDGTLWAGGTFTTARTTDNRVSWTGAFVRFAPRDTTAPSTPRVSSLSRSDNRLRMSWSTVSDAASYEVLIGDRVVATVFSPSVDIAVPASGDRLVAVRARDAAGNLSASTAPVRVP